MDTSDQICTDCALYINGSCPDDYQCPALRVQKKCRDLFVKWMNILVACNELRMDLHPWIDGNNKTRCTHAIHFAGLVSDFATMEYELAMRSLLGMKQDIPKIKGIHAKLFTTNGVARGITKIIKL